MEKAMIFLYSYHHLNTQKIAEVIAAKINARVINIHENPDLTELENCDLVGFGAGIDSGKHYPHMLQFAEKLPAIHHKKAFIFSTSAIYSPKKMLKDHKALRVILENKGFIIKNEFSCKGYNTNSFLKYFGGMNKGRPNSGDLKNAEYFADTLLQ